MNDLKRFALFTFLMIVVSCSPLPKVNTKSNTIYYTVMLDNHKIGNCEYTRTVHDNKVMTTYKMNFSTNRHGSALVQESIEKTCETLEGRPLSFFHKSSEGAKNSSMEITGTITGPKLDVEIKDSDSTIKKQIQWPEGALMAEGLLKVMASKGLKNGTNYSVISFYPGMLATVKTDVMIGQRRPVDLFGRIVDLTEVKTVMHFPQDLSITTTTYVDENLMALKMILPIGEVFLEIIACSKQMAMGKTSSYDFIDTFILKSPKDISGLIKGQAVEYYIIPKKAGKKLSVPAMLGQKVRISPVNGRYITVRRQKMPRGSQYVTDIKDKNILEALKATLYLQKDNKIIAKMTQKAVAGTLNPAEAAERIEYFVKKYIKKKNYSVGYASALEVAKTRQGDCTEHAVLTAAMCRGAGIPARIVLGIVYVHEHKKKDAFLYHAWNEVYIDDRWYGLDSTGVNGGYGPGHIGFTTGDGDPIMFAGMIELMGSFTIKDVRAVE